MDVQLDHANIIKKFMYIWNEVYFEEAKNIEADTSLDQMNNEDKILKILKVVTVQFALEAKKEDIDPELAKDTLLSQLINLYNRSELKPQDVVYFFSQFKAHF